jgi:acetoacetyl-CoA reductase/3-oxoacyl-[acyl-carrier protein] reductase
MIVITGASKGIGRYLFERFKQSGQDVVGTYNNTLNGFENDLECYHKVDISDYMSVSHFVDSIGSELSNIVLINCAGYRAMEQCDRCKSKGQFQYDS